MFVKINTSLIYPKQIVLEKHDRKKTGEYFQGIKNEFSQPSDLSSDLHVLNYMTLQGKEQQCCMHS